MSEDPLDATPLLERTEPMTLEEAGELMLANDPFLVCLDCKAVGFRQAVDPFTKQPKMRTCPTCDFTGWVYHPRYVLAYRMLGMKPPTRPHPLGKSVSGEVAAKLREYAVTDALLTPDLKNLLKLRYGSGSYKGR